MRCTVCGAVSDVSPAVFSGINREIRSVMEELDCDSFYLELSGKCQKCRKQKA